MTWTPPTVRPPTAEEKTMLAEYCLSMENYEPSDPDSAYAEDDIRGFIDQAGIGVIDHYITDGPGYAGRVLFVVWPAAPETHEVFTFEENGGQYLVKCGCDTQHDTRVPRSNPVLDPRD